MADHAVAPVGFGLVHGGVGLVQQGVRQLIVAGGETSGAVVQALAVDRMVELIMEAIVEQPRRVPTRPGRGVATRRRAERERLSGKKKARRRPSEED